MSEIPQIQSVERTFLVVEILSQSGSCSVTELSKLTGLHKTTVFRILNTLVVLGYVYQNKGTGKYSLTLKLLKMTSYMRKDFDIRSFTSPYLKELCQKCGETVHLVEKDGNNIVYIDKYEADNTSVRMASRIGLSHPMIYTAVGKAILSKCDNETVKSVWDNTKMVKNTENTITDFNVFLKEIENTRKTFLSYDNEENEIGVRCIASAIPDISGEFNYAVSISAPVTRLDDITTTKKSVMLLETCEKIIKNI